MSKNFMSALKKACHGKKLNYRDIVNLLQAGPGEQEELFALADIVRRRYLGDEVHLRGIIEFSNNCMRQCLYCGLRASNLAVKRYRMSEEEIINTAKMASMFGLKTVVLQSGEDLFYSIEQLTQIIKRIKTETGLAVTLSVGERSYTDYEIMKKAGADRYLLKQETSNSMLFAILRPGTSLKGRVQCLKWLRELGFQVGSGNMVGLPGQTLETLARDIELMSELDIDMAGIGPFIAHPQTPLAGYPNGTLNMTLNVLAVVRLVMPDINLPATTALETIHSRGWGVALKCGANVIMPNITPLNCRKHYSIYPNKAGGKDRPEDGLTTIVNLIEKLGRKVGTGYGDRIKI